MHKHRRKIPCRLPVRVAVPRARGLHEMPVSVGKVVSFERVWNRYILEILGVEERTN